MTTGPVPMHVPHGLERALAVIGVVALVALVLVLVFRHDIFDNAGSSSGTHGSGHAISQVRAVGPFTGVQLAGSNVVTIHIGDPWRVAVHADDNLISRVTTRVQSGQLAIGNTTGSFQTNSPMSVDVTVPSLAAVTLSGSGTVSVEALDAPALNVTMPGSGSFTASGPVERLTITIAGSGYAQLSGLVASNADATVSGSGSIILDVNNRLEARVPGSGSIIYCGSPAAVSSSITGSGAVIPG